MGDIMSRKIIDRTGETRINNFGSETVIVKYRTNKDIDVYFPEYDWTARSVEYGHFKKGNVKCPYEKRYYGIGYLSEGEYKASENGKHTKCYKTWHHMLERCYDEKYHKKYPTYKDCEVHNELLCFQNFAEWFYDNYYEVEGQRMHLDKDILNKGNKIYSSETCVFVPERINTLFIKSDKVRGNLPIGVNYDKHARKFVVKCNIYDYEENKRKRIYLGLYETPEEAFKVYKQFKEKHIKKIADYYKDQIPDKLYDAMYNYKVDIND